MAVHSKPLNKQSLLSYTSLVHAVAGGCGSAFAMSTFYPLDIVRTKLQVDDKCQAKNTFALLMEIYQEEGLSGLYCGLLPVIQSLYCSNFVYFYIFNALKRSFNQDKSAVRDLMLGMIAGWVNVLSTTPLWVVNTRIKMQGNKSALRNDSLKPKYKNLIHGLLRIYKEEGLSSLWSGTTSSLILAVNPAIQFMTYEMIKRRLGPESGSGSLNSGVVFFMGAAAKLVATCITYPLQLVQTKMRHGHKYEGLPAKPGILALFTYILRLHGVSGLYKGLESKVLQTVSTAALMFVFYEKIVNFVFKILLRSKTFK